MTLTYRRAVPDDIAERIELRGRTRDNSITTERLQELGVTPSSWSSRVAEGKEAGYVCIDSGKIVGYCFGNKTTGEIVVLAILAGWDGKGIGKRLLNMVVRDFLDLGFQRVFLGASSKSQYRSHGFYRHLGWKPSGVVYANGDEELEYFPIPRNASLSASGNIRCSGRSKV